MNEHSFKNWQKIKKALEENNKTECYLYSRACAIVKTGKDPLENSYDS
jgi:hypothetical protein